MTALALRSLRDGVTDRLYDAREAAVSARDAVTERLSHPKPESLPTYDLEISFTRDGLADRNARVTVTAAHFTGDDTPVGRHVDVPTSQSLVPLASNLVQQLTGYEEHEFKVRVRSVKLSDRVTVAVSSQDMWVGLFRDGSGKRLYGVPGLVLTHRPKKAFPEV